VNQIFLLGLGQILGVSTRLWLSSDLSYADGKTDRLVALCNAVGASRYLSGPAAQNYIDANAFTNSGIALLFKSYEGYPEYPQQFPPFLHGVTVLDLLFNVGPDAAWYIWGWRDGPLYA
jgi:hypothetical protein